jgi:hypothetical protein
MSSAWSHGTSFRRSVRLPPTVSLVMMLSPVKSAMTCSTARTSTFWKLSESFSPEYPGVEPCTSLFGSSLTGFTSTMNCVSVWYAEYSQRPRGSITMRAFAPCSKVSTNLTGVAKSPTSRRRTRFFGTVVFRKSTKTWRPWRRMSIPTFGDDRSTTTRPSPVFPRRKSTSRRLLRAPIPGVASANVVDVVGVVAAAWPLVGACAPSMVTTSCLPSSAWLYVRLRVRFITRRVRFAVCTTEMLLSSPSPASSWLRPSALTVSGRSIAMRGGLVTANPCGTAGSASRSPIFTMIFPPWTDEKFTDSTAFRA